MKPAKSAASAARKNKSVTITLTASEAQHIAELMGSTITTNLVGGEEAKGETIRDFIAAWRSATESRAHIHPMEVQDCDHAASILSKLQEVGVTP